MRTSTRPKRSTVFAISRSASSGFDTSVGMARTSFAPLAPNRVRCLFQGLGVPGGQDDDGPLLRDLAAQDQPEPAVRTR